MKQRLPRLVLAIGIVASIATSPAYQYVEDRAVVTQTVLAPEATTQRFAIQLDRSGESQAGIDGNLHAELTLRGGSVGEPTLVTIALESAFDRVEVEASVVADELATAIVDLPAWVTCYLTSPCSEDYTLTVTRAAGDLEVEISGEVVLETEWHSREPEIAVGVTPL